MSLFGGRLMFPISDHQGRVVAFGGRYLEATGGPIDNSRDFKAPKYVNSPEMEIYRKGETLFALDLALPEIRKTKTVYLAEGYMDVMALHQAGITNAVAPLGTAFTDEQARLLSRWAEKAVLVFDSDEAGQRAVVKGILCCRRNRLACAVVVPSGSPEERDLAVPPAALAALDHKELNISKDPADILQNFGPEALQKKMKCFINDFDYLLSRAKSTYDIRDSGGKAQAAAFLFPYIRILESEVSRDACIEAAVAALGTSKSAMLTDWRHFNSGAQERRETGFQKEENNHSSGKNAPIRMNDELYLLMTVAVNDMRVGAVPIYPEFRKTLAIREIHDPYAKELFIALEECFTNDECGLDYFLSRISSPELKKFYLEKGASGEFAVDPQKILGDCTKRAALKRLEHRRDEITFALKTLKMNLSSGINIGSIDTGNKETEELLADKIRVDEELRQLKEASL
jgi:DNA primase